MMGDSDKKPEAISRRRLFERAVAGGIQVTGSVAAAAIFNDWSRPEQVADTSSERRVRNPEVEELYNSLCRRMNSPKRELYLIDDKVPLAAMDKHHVFMTTRFIEILDKKEIEAVLAHEMGHAQKMNSFARDMGGMTALFCSVHIAHLLTHKLTERMDRRRFFIFPFTAYAGLKIGESFTPEMRCLGQEVHADYVSAQYVDPAALVSARSKLEGVSINPTIDAVRSLLSYIEKVRQTVVGVSR